MYLCVRGVDFIEVPVPRQESEQSCICLQEVSILLKCLYQGRTVSSHVLDFFADECRQNLSKKFA
jgi:hypothetical protein